MESVSSCSPTASASPPSAAGPSFVQQSTITTNRRGVELSCIDRTAIVPKTSDVARPRDERRDDTPNVPPPHAKMGDKMRWKEGTAVGVSMSSTSFRFRGQKHQSGSYYVPTVNGHLGWYEHPPPNRWYARGDPAAQHGAPFLHHRVPSTMLHTANDYSRRPVSVPNSTAFGPHGRKDTLFVHGGTHHKNTQAASCQSVMDRNNPIEGPQRYRSQVIIPKNSTIPKQLSPSNSGESPTDESLGKRSSDVSNMLSSDSSPALKRHRTEALEGRFDKLDLLCSATLELGPLQENPSGCSCPKSKCIALYCDCFKAGRRCNPTVCTCLNCLNTVKESGADGARSRAIQAILTRNPRAFTNAANNNNGQNKMPPGEHACNCIRSRCLKLYCTCFQKGKTCSPSCTCVACLNLQEDTSGMRQMAIETTLEKRPDAFKQKNKTKILGAGCACKNNQCIRKYCECFRTNLQCTKKCSCKECKNR